jgi:hypothetical protein
MSKLQEKPSTLKREHPALQKIDLINFFSMFLSHFLPFWIRIRIPNPVGYGSREPIESGSTALTI